MRLKYYYLFFVLGFFMTSCSWLAILDTNPYDDEPADHHAYHEQKVEEYRQMLLGLSKEEVLAKLGKPAWVNQLGENYQSPTKFRENEYVFCDNQKRPLSECGPIVEDESWTYSWERRVNRHYSLHGIGVFFKDGIVSSVQ